MSKTNRLSVILCALYLAVLVWLAWWTATVASHSPAWFTVGNIAAAVVLVIAVTQQLDLVDARRENTDLKQREARREDAELQRENRPTEDWQSLREAADALGHSCCERWWTSLGADHDPTCRKHERTA